MYINMDGWMVEPNGLIYYRQTGISRDEKIAITPFLKIIFARLKGESISAILKYEYQAQLRQPRYRTSVQIIASLCSFVTVQRPTASFPFYFRKRHGEYAMRWSMLLRRVFQKPVSITLCVQFSVLLSRYKINIRFLKNMIYLHKFIHRKT